MKKLVVFLALVSMGISSLAFGIMDQGENSLGVYFDAGTFEVNCIDPPVLEPFSMFFVMANCTQSSIGGFEFAWDLDPDPVGDYIVLSALLPPNSLNIGDNKNLIVGVGLPLVTGPATVLVEFQLLVLTPDFLANITVGPVDPPSIPFNTAFVDGNDPSILIPMTYSTLDGNGVTIDPEGWVRPGIGSFGCPGPVAVEQASWGSLKALFK
jgi:hypothetical protein